MVIGPIYLIIYGDCHKYLSVAQQYWAWCHSYRHGFLAAFFTNIWWNLAYRHKYLAKPYLFLLIGAIMIYSSWARCQLPGALILQPGGIGESIVSHSSHRKEWACIWTPPQFSVSGKTRRFGLSVRCIRGNRQVPRLAPILSEQERSHRNVPGTH